MPLALHFVNSQLGGDDLARATAWTRLFSEILVLALEGKDRELLGDPLAIARFITHLRYLLVRHERGRASSAFQFTGLQQSLRSEHPEIWGTAGRIADLLAERLGGPVGLDERLYIALHVARLTGTSE